MLHVTLVNCLIYLHIWSIANLLHPKLSRCQIMAPGDPIEAVKMTIVGEKISVLKITSRRQDGSADVQQFLRKQEGSKADPY